MTSERASRNGEEARLVEQGLQVFQVSDYEWYLADSADSAIAAALKDWGYESVEQAETEGCFDRSDVGACDLDKNTINLHPDAEEGAKDIVTYREGIRRHVAAGEKVPGFFCGVDS